MAAQKYFLGLAIPLILYVVSVLSVTSYISPLRGISSILNHRPPSNEELETVRLLNLGKNVGNFTGRERTVLRYWIPKIKEIDSAVMGSSRAMQIRNWGQSKSFYNFSVSGACIDDFLAIYDLLEKNKSEPRSLIIGIDPWIYNEQFDATRKEEWGNNYFEFANRFGFKRRKENIFKTELRFIGELLYWEHFRGTFHKFLEKLKSNEQGKIFETDQDYDVALQTKRSDGSYGPSLAEIKKNRKEVADEVEKYVKAKNIYGLENFNRFSPDDKNFEQFIRYLLGKKISIKFYFAPYHPICYRALSEKKYSRIQEMELKIRIFADTNFIECIGSYDPVICGFTDEDFIDFMHAKENSVKRLFIKK